MKKKYKYILLAVILIAAAASAAIYMLSPKKAALAVAKKGTAEIYFIEQGIVETDEGNAEIYPLVSGEIAENYAEDDAPVKKGDVIAVIDSKDYVYQISQNESAIQGYEAQIASLGQDEDKQKDSLRASRDSLSAELKALSAQEDSSAISKEEQLRLQNLLITQSREDLDFAEANLERSQTLYEQGALSEASYEDARKATENSRNILSQNEQQLETIKNTAESGSPAYYQAMKESLEAQIAGLDRTIAAAPGSMSSYYQALISGLEAANEQLRQRIEDCNIRAPYDGVLKNVRLNDMNVVLPQLPVAEIDRGESGKITAYVSTRDIADISEGSEVELTFSKRSGDIVFNGIIEDIEDEAVSRMTALGIEERKIKVKIEPEERQEIELKTGYDVDVKFFALRQENSLMIPKTAVFEAEEGDSVWLVRDGVLTRQTITKGIETRTDVVISEGINENDTVIADVNQEGLKEGTRISGE